MGKSVNRNSLQSLQLPFNLYKQSQEPSDIKGVAFIYKCIHVFYNYQYSASDYTTSFLLYSFKVIGVTFSNLICIFSLFFVFVFLNVPSLHLAPQQSSQMLFIYQFVVVEGLYGATKHCRVVNNTLRLDRVVLDSLVTLVNRFSILQPNLLLMTNILSRDRPICLILLLYQD